MSVKRFSLWNEMMIEHLGRVVEYSFIRQASLLKSGSIRFKLIMSETKAFNLFSSKLAFTFILISSEMFSDKITGSPFAPGSFNPNLFIISWASRVIPFSRTSSWDDSTSDFFCWLWISFSFEFNLIIDKTIKTKTKKTRILKWKILLNFSRCLVNLLNIIRLSWETKIKNARKNTEEVYLNYWINIDWKLSVGWIKCLKLQLSTFKFWTSFSAGEISFIFAKLLAIFP